jgi:hypothetical protein
VLLLGIIAQDGGRGKQDGGRHHQTPRCAVDRVGDEGTMRSVHRTRLRAKVPWTRSQAKMMAGGPALRGHYLSARIGYWRRLLEAETCGEGAAFAY